MRGYIYNNPKLAYENDGFWCYDGKTPHDYWCIIREMDDDLVLIAPIFFDLMDNLPNAVLESYPIQMSDGVNYFTIGIWRAIMRLKEDLTTEPVMFLNPEMAKKAYNIMARKLRTDNNER